MGFKVTPTTKLTLQILHTQWQFVTQAQHVLENVQHLNSQTYCWLTWGSQAPPPQISHAA